MNIFKINILELKITPIPISQNTGKRNIIDNNTIIKIEKPDKYYRERYKLEN